MNAELEKLRSQMREEERKNEDLRKQLATMQAQLKQGGSSPAPMAPITSPTAPTAAPQKALDPPSESAAEANDEGMRLYKEKRYADAVAKFTQASNLQPANALFTNNVGFACYRMEQYDEAAKWFLRTIALDPNRAVAYLNLGDAYVNLQKKAEARDAYAKYLALVPNSKTASDVRQKMQSLR